MSFTYGSFGDIITTVQVVCRFAQALSESRGSAREFQDLIVELRLYQNTLQQFIPFWERKRHSPQLSDLANIVRPAISESRETIDAFLKKGVTKYGSTLLRGADSRKSIRDVFKMIQWNLCEKEDVKSLREQLHRSMSIIQSVQIQAHLLADEENGFILAERVASRMDTEGRADAKIDAQFAAMIEKLDEGNKTILRVEAAANAIYTTMSTIGSNVLAIKNMMYNVEQVVLALPGMMTRLSLFNQNVVYVEDALGWVLPILLDARPSWETVDSIMKDQFTSQCSPGLELVKSRRYALHDERTGRDAIRSTPLYQVARPGQRIVMSMVLDSKYDKSGGSQESTCPRCGRTDMVNDPDLDVTCASPRCGLIYRKVLDVTNFEDEYHFPEINNLESNHADNDEEEDLDITTAVRDNNIHTGEFLTNGPEIFKRVRFLSRWETLAESRGTPFNTFRGWHISGYGAAGMAAYQIRMSLSVQILLYIQWIYTGVEKLALNNIGFIFAYIGTTRESSVPTIVVMSLSKQVRRRCSKVLNRLSWLGKGSRIPLIISQPSAFGVAESWMRRVNNTEPKHKIEAKKRVKLLRQGQL